jgi:hypothetical protein
MTERIELFTALLGLAFAILGFFFRDPVLALLAFAVIMLVIFGYLFTAKKTSEFDKRTRVNRFSSEARKKSLWGIMLSGIFLFLVGSNRLNLIRIPSSIETNPSNVDSIPTRVPPFSNAYQEPSQIEGTGIEFSGYFQAHGGVYFQRDEMDDLILDGNDFYYRPRISMLTGSSIVLIFDNKSNSSLTLNRTLPIIVKKYQPAGLIDVIGEGGFAGGGAYNNYLITLSPNMEGIYWAEFNPDGYSWGGDGQDDSDSNFLTVSPDEYYIFDIGTIFTTPGIYEFYVGIDYVQDGYHETFWTELMQAVIPTKFIRWSPGDVEAYVDPTKGNVYLEYCTFTGSTSMDPSEAYSCIDYEE